MEPPSSFEEVIRAQQEQILVDFAKRRSKIEERHKLELKELEEEKNMFLRRVTDSATTLFNLGMQFGNK